MPLTDRAIRQLCIRARQGSRSARDRLLQTHLGLITHIARRFYRSGAFLELADLIQQGSLGLLYAIQKFDPYRVARGRPVQFATYAHYWIAHSIRREIQTHGRLIALPSSDWIEDENGRAFARVVDVEDPCEDWAQVWEARRTVEYLLNKLSPATQTALRYRYGLNETQTALTQSQTGQLMGMSGTRVGQLERAGLHQLQQYGV